MPSLKKVATLKELHTKPIGSLESVEEGVAEFEIVHTAYQRAGALIPSDSELKSDLLRILRREIRGLLLWHSANIGVCFAKFRDTLIAQTAQVPLE